LSENDQVNEDEMDTSCGTHGRELVGNPKGKKPLGRRKIR
jgi:hypothetical protein